MAARDLRTNGIEPFCRRPELLLKPGRTHGEGRLGVDLVLGGDAEAGVAVAGGPGQVHGRLQLLVHLLVDGAAELGAVVSGEETEKLQVGIRVAAELIIIMIIIYILLNK